MKTKLTLLLLLLAWPVLAQQAPKAVTLEWDYPAQMLTNTSLSFRLRHSLSIETPKELWAVVTNVPAPLTRVTIAIVPGEHFFVLTAVDSSNFWLESDFSNVASTPSPPLSGILHIRLGE